MLCCPYNVDLTICSSVYRDIINIKLRSIGSPIRGARQILKGAQALLRGWMQISKAVDNKEKGEGGGHIVFYSCPLPSPFLLSFSSFRH